MIFCKTSIFMKEFILRLLLGYVLFQNKVLIENLAD